MCNGRGFRRGGKKCVRGTVGVAGNKANHVSRRNHQPLMRQAKCSKPKGGGATTAKKHGTFLANEFLPVTTSCLIRSRAKKTYIGLAASRGFSCLCQSTLQCTSLVGIELPFHTEGKDNPHVGVATLCGTLSRALPRRIGLRRETKELRFYLCEFRS